MKTIQAVYDAVNRGDIDAMVPLYAEDCVVDLSESIGPDKDVLRGRDAAVAMWHDWMEHWEAWTWELENATEVPPNTVVAANRVRGTGRGSGIEVDARVGQVWRVADGRVTCVKMFQSEAEALAAAGV